MEQLNKERELTREERLEIEEKAIQALVNMGVKFNVPLKINPVKPPRFIRWWNRYFPNHVKMWRDKRIPKGWDVSETEVPNAALQTMERVYMRFVNPDNNRREAYATVAGWRVHRKIL